MYDLEETCQIWCVNIILYYNHLLFNTTKVSLQTLLYKLQMQILTKFNRLKEIKGN